MNISDTSILITGAGKGIGNHLAKELYKEAKKIIVVDNNKELLDHLKNTLENVTCYECDLTEYEQVLKTCTAIYNAHPEVDVLINNAGFIHSEPLINLLDKEDKRHGVNSWHNTININLNSVFYMTSCIVEQMVIKRIKGLIINISSISAQGNAGQSAYSAAKAGVNALTRTWSKELGMYGIRSTAIAPGFFETESTRESLSEANIKKWEKNIAVGRLGEVNEIFKSVKFIIENDYINGKILEIDGGLNI